MDSIEIKKKCDSRDVRKNPEQERDLFNKAREFVSSSFIFRLAANFYSERKLMVFTMAWLCVVAVVYTHFAIKTGNHGSPTARAAKLGDWWIYKYFPMIEAGGVNAILSIISLLPLTMCRFTISKLSDTFPALFIPLNRLKRVHITFAYLWMLLVAFLLPIFITFIANIISTKGRDNLSDVLNFGNQMFVTGYGIMFCMIGIFTTSILRQRIRYEIFYYVHQLTLVFAVLMVFHTLGKFRAKLNQTYPWVAPSFLYYMCDRLCFKLFHCEDAPLVSATMIDEEGDGAKAMILRLRRPTLFSFKSGQSAYLLLKGVDRHWHPFSIMSDPADSEHLEFFIQVVGNPETSWTSKLYKTIQNSKPGDLVFKVQGPCGESLGNPEKYSHVLAIGTGTGIVPVVSLLKNHIGRLLRLQPETHIATLEDNSDKIVLREMAERALKGSLTTKVAATLRLRKNRRKIQDEKSNSIRDALASGGDDGTEITRARFMKMKVLAAKASRSLYGTVLLSLMPIFGIFLIGVTLSWNTVPVFTDSKYPTPWSMSDLRHTAMVLTAVFHGIFAVVACGFWNANSFAAFIDTLLVLVAPLADWLWFLRLERVGNLIPTDLLLYTLLMAYFTARFWYAVVKPRKSSWKAATQIPGVSTLERLDVVWIVRSAVFVSQMLPEIDESYGKLVSIWGQENVDRVCRIQIHLTDMDMENNARLTKEIARSAVFQAGCLHIGRPNLESIVENHTLDLVTSHTNSYTLMSYCGSMEMSSKLQQIKVTNDMLKTITGNGNHLMEYESECREANLRKTKAQPKKADEKKPNDDDFSADVSEEMKDIDLGVDVRRALTRRSTLKFDGKAITTNQDV